MENNAYTKTAIVVGAGIVGLATARALAIRNYRVTVIERTTKAVGASIRNFGMIWPIGQPDGGLFETAALSRTIWKEICTEANIWHDEVGSLHVANNQEEWAVLQELEHAYRDRGYQLLSKNQTKARSPFVATDRLMGSLYSKDEMIVDPRKAIAAIPAWLSGQYGVTFVWEKAVTSIEHPVVYAGSQKWEADLVFVCSGADFETLYPEIYAQQPFTKCKLQMMRMGAQPDGMRIGPALCGGLSLVHYNSFKAASSLPVLKQKYEEEYPEYLKWGIHVMAAQNQEGELTIGDSHEYGMTHEPFDKAFVNQLITDYLGSFVQLPNTSVVETWNGIYPKLTNGGDSVVVYPEDGVTIVNGLGGAGMTLSFGLCERTVGTMGLL